MPEPSNPAYDLPCVTHVIAAGSEGADLSAINDSMGDVIKALRDENGNYLIPREVDSDPTARVDEADERWAPRLAIQKLAEIRFAGINTMKRLAGGLELTSSSRAKSTYDHKTGARTIEFEDERDAKINGNKVTLPDFFLLSIPLFQGDPPALLPVRPVARFGGGSLKWGFILAHIDRVIARRVRRVGDEIAETTGVPVYFGSLTS